jgi:cytoskeletal protein CcmA (bactofilin family)
VFKRRKPEEPQPPSAGGTNDDFVPQRAAMPEPRERRDSGGGRLSDSGLGVPPFRPMLSREMLNAGRSQMPHGPGAGGPGSSRGVAPQGRTPSREVPERRTLVVGHGISLQGTVQDAERLVVEGTVEATLIRATELTVAVGGVFKGEIEVDDAEIGGVIDGTLTVHSNLLVRASGKVLGMARCRRLQVEDGGQITGRIEMIVDGGPALLPPAAAPPAAAV